MRVAVQHGHVRGVRIPDDALGARHAGEAADARGREGGREMRRERPEGSRKLPQPEAGADHALRYARRPDVGRVTRRLPG